METSCVRVRPPSKRQPHWRSHSAVRRDGDAFCYDSFQRCGWLYYLEGDAGNRPDHYRRQIAGGFTLALSPSSTPIRLIISVEVLAFAFLALNSIAWYSSIMTVRQLSYLRRADASGHYALDLTFGLVDGRYDVYRDTDSFSASVPPASHLGWNTCYEPYTKRGRWSYSQRGPIGTERAGTFVFGRSGAYVLISPALTVVRVPCSFVSVIQLLLLVGADLGRQASTSSKRF